MTDKSPRVPVVAIVGSASEPLAPELFAAAVAVGRGIVDAGCRVVTGGLTGVMKAASHGARQSARCGDGSVIGILPSYDRTTANEFVQIAIPTGMQLARNVLVVASADVVIAVGGGSGTLSEIALAWQLGKPVVALAGTGGWSDELAGKTLDWRGAAPIHSVASADEAVRLAVDLTTAVRLEPGAVGSKWRGGVR